MKKPASLRIATLSSGTPFLDGYATASASLLITSIPDLAAWEIGALTSSYFIGFFIGSALLGSAADRWGRRPLYIAAMAVVLASTLLASAAADTPACVPLLIAMRAASGLALGGDYPVGQALVSESLSEADRNRALSLLMLGWYIGACFGALLGLAFVRWPLPWEVVLWIQAGIAALLMIGRSFIPESPEWLKTRAGRPAGSAAEDCRSALSASADGSPPDRLTRRNMASFAFCAVFWLCQTVPATALMFYSSLILSESVGAESASIQVLLLYACFLLGVLPAAAKPLAARPKAVLCTTFLVMSAALFIIALAGLDNAAATGAAFILFAAAYGLQTPLDFVFPNALFPAKHRGFFVGAVTAVSRLGALCAAMLVPALLERHAPEAVFLAGAALLLFGFVFSFAAAPPDGAGHAQKRET